MTRILTVLASLVTLGVVITAQTPAPPSREVRERAWQANNIGVAYLEQFNHAKAATQFEAALGIDPTLVPARVNLAIARLYDPTWRRPSRRARRQPRPRARHRMPTSCSASSPARRTAKTTRLPRSVACCRSIQTMSHRS
jgi:hypothetical protein